MITDNIRTLCKGIYHETAPGIGDPQRYVSLDAEIRSALAGFSGTKCSISRRWDELEDELRLSLVLSDITSIFLDAKQDCVFCLLSRAAGNWPSQFVVPAEIFQPGAFLGDVVIRDGIPSVHPSFRYPTDAEVGGFTSQLGRLAEAGRIIIRPKPVLLAETTQINNLGNKTWKQLSVEPDSPCDTWIGNLAKQEAVPITSKAETIGCETKLCEFMLPYLRGIPFGALAQVLDDEQDCLAAFRLSIKKLLEEMRKDASLSKDVLNDCVRPAVDQVERRFRQVVGVYGSKCWLSLVAMSLSALTASGVQASLAALLGAGGLAFLAKEYSEYRKEVAQLQELPFHLLWRLGNHRPP